MKIDFEDYGKENRLFSEKILRSIAGAMELRSEHEYEKYILEFERQFADYNRSKHAVAVNSGTTALQLALKAAGVENGREVILPAYTYISTALAVSNLGARPVFADIKEDTLTINQEEIKKRISANTKAIIPVHIHGNPCEMDEILRIAGKYNLAIIEDVSHAHGAEFDGVRTGNFGIGCFSNHNTKILSGIGNSGLITTSDVRIYQTIIEAVKVSENPALRLSQRTPCRINILQAAVLKTKLTYLDKLIEKRRANASAYIECLPKSMKFQKTEKKSRHVYRDFVVLAEKREKLRVYLQKNGVAAKARYRLPLHLTDYYRCLGFKKGSFPVAEAVCDKALCLPVSFYLSKKDIEYTCKKLKDFNSRRQ